MLIGGQKNHVHYPPLRLTAKAPESQRLEDEILFYWGFGLFSGATRAKHDVIYLATCEKYCAQALCYVSFTEGKWIIWFILGAEQLKLKEAFYLLRQLCSSSQLARDLKKPYPPPWKFNMDIKNDHIWKDIHYLFQATHFWSAYEISRVYMFVLKIGIPFAPCSSVVQLPIFLHDFIITSSSSNITGIGRLYSPSNLRCLSVIREWDQHMFVGVQTSKWPGKHPKFEQLPLGPSRNHIPHAPCMEDLPTFGINLWFPCR